jgi:hypothetical protein
MDEGATDTTVAVGALLTARDRQPLAVHKGSSSPGPSSTAVFFFAPAFACSQRSK